jgi:hypothetical protein
MDFINYKVLCKEVVVTDTLYLHQGWNWVSFPKLERTQNNYVNAIDLFRNIQPLPDYMKLQDTSGIGLESDCSMWDPSQYHLCSTQAFKLHLKEDKDFKLSLTGTKLGDNYPIEMGYGYNWVGYWLRDSQNYQDALAEGLDKVFGIIAQDWYAFNLHGNWYGYIGVAGGTFEYGKGYIIITETPFVFQWTNSGKESTFVKDDVAEILSYKETKSYTAVDIENIDCISDAVEVGAFLGDECVGASVIKSFPVHLKVYIPPAREYPDFRFAVADSSGILEFLDDVMYLDTEHNVYESQDIFPFTKGYYNVNLGLAEYEVAEFGKIESSFGTTSIDYIIKQATDVTLQIFNAKGQLVKTLVKGKQEQGNYSVTWSGKDENNKSVSSGIYYSRIETAGKVLNKKMVLMK